MQIRKCGWCYSACAAILVLGLAWGTASSFAQTGPGYALSVGSSSVNVPHQTSLNAYPLTVTAWVRTSRNDAAYRGIVSKVPAALTNGYAITLKDGRVRAAYARSGISYVLNGVEPLDGGYIDDGAWHHIAFVVNASGGYLYVDGEERDHQAWTGSAGACTLSQNLSVGRYQAANLDGEIDEVAVWRAARTQSEIQSGMHRPLTGAEANLVGYWRFDEGSGATASNSASSGGSLGGTILNSPAWVLSGALFVPDVVSWPATNAAPASASLRGSVHSGNLPTDVWFEWGATTNYDHFTTSVSLPGTNTLFHLTNVLSGLTPDAGWHYRVAASNRVGVTTGADVAFATLPVPARIAVTSTNADTGPGTLREAMILANQAGGPHTLVLATGAVYTFSVPDNYWYGPNALPPVASEMVFEGHGATLTIASDVYRLRFFYVGADPTHAATLHYNSPGAGRLTLSDLTLLAGRIRGGSSGMGGGGAGMGGAIFSQGQVSMENVLLYSNCVWGGKTGDYYGPDTRTSGGGMGGDATYDAGGGFGGPVTPAGSLGFQGGGGFGSNDNGTTYYGGGVANGLGGGSDSLGDMDGSGGNGSGSGWDWGGNFGCGGTRPSSIANQGGGGGVGGGGGGGLMVNPNIYRGGSGGFGGGGGGIRGAGGFGAGGGLGGGPGGFGAGDGDFSGSYVGGGGAGMGGAVFNHNGRIAATNCRWVANEAWGGWSYGGPDGRGLGGALFNLNGEVTASACLFSNNLVAPTGMNASAIYNIGYDSALVRTAVLGLVSCTFTSPVNDADVVNHQPVQLGTWLISNRAFAAVAFTGSNSIPGLTNNGGRVMAALPTVGPVAADVNGQSPGGAAWVGVEAAVNPNGRPTAVWFQFGLEKAAGERVPATNLAASVSDWNCRAVLQGVVPGMRYSLCCTASNDGGWVVGPERSLFISGPYPPGDTDGDGLVDQGEADSVMTAYWATGPWVAITNAEGLGHTSVVFKLADPLMGAYNVESSTNLTTWTNLGPATPLYHFADTNAPASVQRFYRLRQP